MSTTVYAWPLTVTIGGVEYPRARLVAARHALLPDVGAATLRLPVGKLLQYGESAPADAWGSEILPRLAVVLALSGDGAPDWTWKGEVVSTEEIAGPEGCELSVECQGPAAVLARFALTSVYWRRTMPTVEWVLAELEIYNGGGGNRALLGAPNYDLFVGEEGEAWTQLLAMQHQLDCAHHLLECPRFTCHGASEELLDHIDVWDTRGHTVMESLMVILGMRSRLALRVEDGGEVPQLVPVDLWEESDRELDLTRAEVAGYRLERNGSGTVGSMRVIANGWVRVMSVYWSRTGGANQEINPLWSPEDEAAPAADNPAWRAWELGVLPDVTGWCTEGAQILDGLPLVITGETDTVAPWLAAPFRVFVQRPWGWEDWTGRVTVTTPDRTSLRVIGGQAWIDAVKTCVSVGFTVAIRNGAPAEELREGGQGVGSPRIDVVNHDVRIDPDATTGVVAGGLVATNAVDSSLIDLEVQADRLWPALRDDRIRIWWTEVGYAADIAVGDRFARVKLPGGRTVTIPGGVVISRSLTTEPTPATSMVIDLPPPNLAGIA